jgi:hypothetical protein
MCVAAIVDAHAGAGFDNRHRSVNFVRRRRCPLASFCFQRKQTSRQHGKWRPPWTSRCTSLLQRAVSALFYSQTWREVCSNSAIILEQIRKKGWSYKKVHLSYNVKMMAEAGFFLKKRGFANARAAEVIYIAWSTRVTAFSFRFLLNTPTSCPPSLLWRQCGIECSRRSLC